MRKLLFLFTLVTFAIVISGCARMMGNLRRDLDDTEPSSGSPTMGGVWTERGMLDDTDRYAAVGHSERNPASADFNGSHGRSSWITPDQQDANRRDVFRGDGENEDEENPLGQSYSSNPNMAPSTKRQYKNGSRATRADFIDESASEGSLWASDGQTNYYFTKNKVRSVGDIITISTQDALVKDVTTEIARTLTPREKEIELENAQLRLERQALGLENDKKKDSLKTAAAAPTRAPAGAKVEEVEDKPAPEVRRATSADIDVSQSMEFKGGEPIMAEIVERYPNGNYKIRGTKRIRYKNGFRLLNLVGVVRGTDIAEKDDTVESGKLYEYRLEVLR